MSLAHTRYQYNAHQNGGTSDWWGSLGEQEEGPKTGEEFLRAALGLTTGDEYAITASAFLSRTRSTLLRATTSTLVYPHLQLNKDQRYDEKGVYHFTIGSSGASLDDIITLYEN